MKTVFFIVCQNFTSPFDLTDSVSGCPNIAIEESKECLLQMLIFKQLQTVIDAVQFLLG